MQRLGSSALLVRDQSVRLTYALDLDDMQYANMEDEIQGEIETAETQAELDKVLDVAFQITSLARQGSGELRRSMTSLRRPSMRSQASSDGLTSSSLSQRSLTRSLSQRSRTSLVSRVLSPRSSLRGPKCSVGDHHAGNLTGNPKPQPLSSCSLSLRFEPQFEPTPKPDQVQAASRPWKAWESRRRWARRWRRSA